MLFICFLAKKKLYGDYPYITWSIWYIQKQLEWPIKIQFDLKKIRMSFLKYWNDNILNQLGLTYQIRHPYHETMITS
jgi:hypothetical protein